MSTQPDWVIQHRELLDRMRKENPDLAAIADEARTLAEQAPASHQHLVGIQYALAAQCYAKLNRWQEARQYAIEAHRALRAQQEVVGVEIVLTSLRNAITFSFNASREAKVYQELAGLIDSLFQASKDDPTIASACMDLKGQLAMGWLMPALPSK